MKFTTIVFSAALIAGAVAQSTTETVVVTTTATVNTASTGTTTVSNVPIPTETNSSYGPEVDECMTECKQGDVGCLATCLGNPNPTEEQVNETTKCSAACKQGDGSEEQTKAYAKCQWDCVLKYYLPNSSLVPTVGGTKTAGDDTATQTAPGTTTVVETDSEGNPTKTVTKVDSTVTTSSGTSTPSTTEDDNSAPAKVYGASFAGAAAAVAAFLAL